MNSDNFTVLGRIRGDRDGYGNEILSLLCYTQIKDRKPSGYGKKE